MIEQSGSQATALLSIVGAFLMFVFILALAYFVTRFLAGRYAGGSGGRSSSVEVLERTALGPDRSLLVVRVAGKVYLLGMTPHQISPIGELDPESFAGTTAQNPSTSFSAALQSAIKGFVPQKKPEQEKGNKDE